MATAKIRPATLRDIGPMVNMGMNFHAASRYAKLINANRKTIEKTLMAMLCADSHQIMVADIDGTLVGMLGLCTYPHPVSGEFTAAELFWWVEPEHRGTNGLRLLKKAESWAIRQGVTTLQMIAPTTEVEKLYDRLGYQRVEVNYQKRLESR